MDGKEFDQFARLFAANRSRRLALKMMLGGVVGISGLRATTSRAANVCFGFDVECLEDANCCSGSCTTGACTCVSPGSVCFTNDDCCSGLVCIEGAHFSGADACGIADDPGACDETTPCDGECCDGYVCNPDTLFCELESACAEGEAGTCVGFDSDCCDGYYCVGQSCVEIPTCAPLYCSSKVVCCDNKVCLDSGGNPNDGEFSGGSCYIRVGQLCDENGDQGCEVGECIDGYCGGAPECVDEGTACDAGTSCCGDLVCTDGTCTVDSTGGGGSGGDGEGTPVDNASGGDGNTGYEAPTSLPATGAGPSSIEREGTIIAGGLAAGVAAWLIGNTLNGATKRSDETSTD